MEMFNQNQQSARRDRFIELYVEGLDTRDDTKIAFVLAAALDDAELDRRLDDINTAFIEELGLSNFGDLPNTVRELARENFQSAFEAEKRPKPLTIGDVAKQLEINQNVPANDAAANHALTENETPLPKTMSLNEIKRLAGELKITASNFFWRKFHGVAMMLRANRSQETALLAARQKRLIKQFGENYERGNKTENK